MAKEKGPEKSGPKEPKQELMLFAPKSTRGLKFDYPELAQNPVLKDLRPQELLFVWYYACKSSPYYNLNWSEPIIIKKCMEAADLYISDGPKKANFLSGVFPDSIKEAIPVMNNYEPNLRILLKIDAAETIYSIRKMTSLSLDEHGNHPQFLTKDAEVDFNKKKTYMSMFEKREEMLPKLLSKAEFGLIDSKDSKAENKNTSDSGKTYAEEFHEQ